MKVYKTTSGILIEKAEGYFLMQGDWNSFINDENLHNKLSSVESVRIDEDKAEELISNELLPPIGNQEIWASGVTYYRSREARMDESKDAGGGDFYDRVYDAERPELFFKATPYRTAGPGQPVRIRKDSNWNVPEPELTLFISSSGKIVGYTAGNDMSSRDIEGENPLYLPQAKTYDGSASIGPCIFVPESPIPSDTSIQLEIRREDAVVFGDEIQINQIKRDFNDLAEFLFRESSFPDGCFLMTGTGIVPPNEFTLLHGDEIRITIDHIGTLINKVE
jgi:2-dehydro-3-deoxy-D-arabinonate dehydratase